MRDGRQRTAKSNHTLRGALLTAVLSLLAGVAQADGIARWVDAKGTTHFGSAHLAPVSASRIEVAEVNAMDVPVSGPEANRNAIGPVWTKLTLPPKKNKKGWRPRKESLYNGGVTNRRGRR